MRVLGLREAMLFVRDLPAQAAFYGDVLGLERLYPETAEDLADSLVAWFALGNVRLALHAGGEGEPGSDGPCLVLSVKDLETAHAELLASGVEVQDILRPEDTPAYVTFFDPEGFILQIEQSE